LASTVASYKPGFSDLTVEPTLLQVLVDFKATQFLSNDQFLRKLTTGPECLSVNPIHKSQTKT
jgi:hypothetical protein